ncbi:MAG TPA: cupin domain-containing protein [Gaiellaceae bacterium]|nr:cupin domain-containing protein [Gaiellaceae bacterium]
MDGCTVKRIDDLTAIHHGAVKLAADELGVRSFGLQVLDFPAGFDAYPEHDHAEDGQEEVYVVLEGSAEFTVAGEPVAAETGSMIRVAPGVRRKLVPGAYGVRVLAIGSVLEGTYERPDDFRVGAPA